jgi:DNA-binding NarL/FixJ family response regulator
MTCYGSLTPHENRILLLMCEGLTNKDIAKVTGFHEKTVRNTVSRILEKLHVANRTQAVLHALGHEIHSREPRSLPR